MKKLIALFTIAATLTSIAALAGPPAKGAKKMAKTTDVWTCPVTGEAITDHKGTGAPVVMDKYTVHFCCAGCPEKFAKLTDKEKKAKVAAAVKKDAPAKAKKS